MPAIEHLSWSEIGRICDVGGAPELINVGDTKPVQLLDGTSITLRCIGLNHDELAGGGTAPVTWEMVSALPRRRPMNRNGYNYGGWERTDVRRWLNRDFYTLLPDDLRAIIKPVVKLTSAGDEEPTIIRTEDKLWLPSEVEVFGGQEYSYPGEGSQYRLYAMDRRFRRKVYEGTAAAYWWLRSPHRSYDCSFCSVSTGGSPSGNNAASSLGLAAALAT